MRCKVRVEHQDGAAEDGERQRDSALVATDAQHAARDGACLELAHMRRQLVAHKRHHQQAAHLAKPQLHKAAHAQHVVQLRVPPLRVDVAALQRALIDEVGHEVGRHAAGAHLNLLQTDQHDVRCTAVRSDPLVEAFTRRAAFVDVPGSRQQAHMLLSQRTAAERQPRVDKRRWWRRHRPSSQRARRAEAVDNGANACQRNHRILVGQPAGRDVASVRVKHRDAAVGAAEPQHARLCQHN
mmetsp:Transcript_14449/g.42101  ORF Transcript_14449/g.42101 Transcript_14449/m.42101 type:complete len:240 (-) Transcript_14449:2883-3602(-)